MSEGFQKAPYGENQPLCGDFFYNARDDRWLHIRQVLAQHFCEGANWGQDLRCKSRFGFCVVKKKWKNFHFIVNVGKWTSYWLFWLLELCDSECPWRYSCRRRKNMGLLLPEELLGKYQYQVSISGQYQPYFKVSVFVTAATDVRCS